MAYDLPTGNWRDTLTSLHALIFQDVQTELDARGWGEDIAGAFYYKANAKYLTMVLQAVGLDPRNYSHVDLGLWDSVTMYKKSDFKAQPPAPAGLVDPITALNFIEAYGRATNTIPGDAAGVRDGIVFAINNGLSVQSAVNYAREYINSHNSGFTMGSLIKIGVGIIFSAAAAPYLTAMANTIGTSVGLTGEAATAVGKIAIATAQNGGNVEKAVKNYGVSYISQGAGNQIGDFVDSESAGKLVSAATGAALKGGDIQGAVGGAALSLGLSNLSTGASNVSFFDDDDAGDVVEINPGEFTPIETIDNPGELPTMETGTDYTFTEDGSTMWTDSDGSIFVVGEDGSVMHEFADGTAYVTDAEGNTYQVDAEGNAIQTLDTPVTEAGGSIWATISNGIDSLGSLMAQGIKLNAAWQKLKGPAPRVASTIRTANGSTITPNKNGTITTRTPDGKVTTGKMPVGTPFVFPDGSTVINNGDGTITVLNADGTTYTQPIAKSQGDSNTGLLVIGAIVGFLVLKG